MTVRSAEFSFDGSKSPAGSDGDKEQDKRDKAEEFRRQHQGTSKHKKWQQGLDQEEGGHSSRKQNRRVPHFGR